MPSIDKVIEINEQVLSLSTAPPAIIGTIIWLFLVSAFVFHLIKEKKGFSLRQWVLNGFIFAVLLTILGGLSFEIKDYDFSINENEWKKNYLNPYLKSLPENKEEVEDFSQILTDDADALKSIYINDKEKPVLVEITTLNKEKGITEKTPIEVIIQKEPITKPYLTYKTIEKNISSEYTTKQHYETVLHIPNEYKVLAPTK